MNEEEEDALLSNEGGSYNGGKRFNKSSYLSRKPELQVHNQINEEEHEDDDNENDDDDINDKKLSSYDYKIIQSNKSSNFQCNMIEIHFETQNLDNPNPGYYIRLETIQDK